MFRLLNLNRECSMWCLRKSILIKARNGFDALHIVAKQGDLDILQVLLTVYLELAMTVDLPNTTTFHTTATQGHIDIVKFLLEVALCFFSIRGFFDSFVKTEIVGVR